MRQTIKIIEHKTLKVPFQRKDAYQYRGDRPFKWVQKCCIYILNRIGAYSWDMEEHVKQYTIDPATVMDSLYKQKRELMNLAHNEKGEVFMGKNNFLDLCNQVAPNQVTSFLGPYFHSDNDGREVLGMKVTIVPWLDGVVVVPENRRY